MKKAARYIPVRASFDAASRSSESMRHWRGADVLSADAALSPEVRKIIISRSRYEVANNGYACGILNTLADDCIGTGPRLQLFPPIGQKEDQAAEWEERLERRERRWAKWCKGVGLCQKLKIARRTKAMDGEIFIRKEINPKIRGLVKLDLTLFESEQIGSSTFTFIPEYYDNGNPKEVDGILYDQDGNATDYRFWRIHPGAVGFRSTLDSYTVKAQNVIHYANIVRPGQHRGISEIASSLPIFNDLRRFTNAVLAAAETAAEVSFLLQTDLPPSDEEAVVHLDPGTILEFCRNAGISLPEGWRASQLKAEQPTSTFSEFVRAKIREASRALSMPMNVALGDSSGYNYASGRLDHQTYFRMVTGERSLIADTVLDDILETYETLDRIFYPEDYADDVEIDHDWIFDGFQHVDPLKEANAQAVRLQSKTTTLAEECGADGKDWQKTLRQKIYEEATEQKLRKAYGLPDATPAAGTPKGETDPDGDEQ